MPRLKALDDGNTTIWVPGEGNFEDLRFPVTAINPPGIVSDPDRDTTDGALLFDPALNEIIFGIGQLPHSWDTKSLLYPHLHWQPTDNSAGNVVWRLEYDIANVGGAFSGVFTSDDIVVAAGGSANGYQADNFSAFSIPNAKVSATIKWKITRVAVDALDTYAADAKLVEVDFHYRINSIGSGELFPKF